METVDPNIAGPTDTERDAALETLLLAGERRRALSALMQALNFGAFERVVSLVPHPALEGTADGLLPEILKAATDNPYIRVVDADAFLAGVRLMIASRNVDAVGSLPWAAPLHWQRIADDPVARAEAIEHAAQNPALAPFDVLCDTACPGSGAACRLALAMSGPPPALVTLSPAEAVLPTDVWQASPRFAADLAAQLRRPAFVRDIRDRLARVDACVADLVHPAP
jgi:hypothetical protein